MDNLLQFYDFFKDEDSFEVFLESQISNVFLLRKWHLVDKLELASLKIGLITKMSYITHSEKQFYVKTVFWTVLNDNLYLNRLIHHDFT